MLLGVDLDNTLVCYDRLFHSLALEKGLITPGTPQKKEQIRDLLCANRKEEQWTFLQGEVYGARMEEAEPFSGLIEALNACKQRGWQIAVVSHRTRTPYRGPPYDLHTAARNWLKGWKIPCDQVYLEETKEQKLQRIAILKCALFVDDLPELLADPRFPKQTLRICFGGEGGDCSFRNWNHFHQLFIQGGRNNRLYRTGNRVIKRYCPDVDSRLVREWAFSTFAWQQGIRSIPEPLECSLERNQAVYRYTPGKRIASVTHVEVDAAAEFFAHLNRYRKQADHLPIAKEACFSVQEHIALVENRIEKLLHLEWVREKLKPKFKKVLNVIECNENPVERCISPSDFGYHNAISSPDGQLIFCDFEYAGWDDPAKMVCDFFCQVEVPVSDSYWERFVDRALESFPEAKKRAERLLPLYKIKWCCILLGSHRIYSGFKENFEQQVAQAENLIGLNH